jgi:hypothetical protein
MIDPSMLPRDANGLVCGAWRLVHENQAFSGELGVVPFRDGTSVHPIAGRVLLRLSAVVGHMLYLEPWGDLPRGFRMPEGHTAKVPDSFLAKLKRAPWRDAQTSEAPAADVEPSSDADASAEGLDTLSREDLLALAELHEVAVDRRWGTTKIIAALQGAGITGA